MSEQRLIDPTRTFLMQREAVDRLTRPIDNLKVTLLAQADYDTMLAVMNEMLITYERETSTYMQTMIQAATERGFWNADHEISRLSPDYMMISPTGLATPADYALLLNSQEIARTSLRDFTSDMRKELSNIISDAMKKRLDIGEVRDTIAERLNVNRQRAEKIARTEPIRAFNTASADRMKRAGIEHYRFYASQDERVCTDEKRLRNDEIVQGCESLHNKVFPIDDSDHRPPIHPNCRCTILPENPK